jgi:hypothetical protein
VPIKFIKPIKRRIQNAFVPIKARPNHQKPVRTALAPAATKKANPDDALKRELVILHSRNKKGFYNGPERIDPQQLQWLDEAETEE